MGTTQNGGTSMGGNIFRITSSGVLTSLYSFCSQGVSCPDGSQPYAPLVQATDGDLYGTTEQGGASNEGTVFSLSLGLRPFVTALPTSGAAGATVKILGTDLTGATAVTFNGTTAKFTVVQKTEIEATVPAGATTGRIKVATPDGTLSSNVAFRVRP